jgi:hypothetical protein
VVFEIQTKQNKLMLIVLRGQRNKRGRANVVRILTFLKSLPLYNFNIIKPHKSVSELVGLNTFAEQKT